MVNAFELRLGLIWCKDSDIGSIIESIFSQKILLNVRTLAFLFPLNDSRCFETRGSEYSLPSSTPFPPLEILAYEFGRKAS